MELGKLHPQARLWAPPTGTGSWSPASKLQKSRQDVQWVFSCYKFLHIKKKKKKKSCTCQDGKRGLPTGEPRSRAHGLGVERLSRLFPHPPQSPNPSKVNGSPQIKKQVQCSGHRRQGGAAPQGKEETLLLLAEARVFTRGNINYSVPKLALLF